MIREDPGMDEIWCVVDGERTGRASPVWSIQASLRADRFAVSSLSPRVIETPALVVVPAEDRELLDLDTGWASYTARHSARAEDA